MSDVSECLKEMKVLSPKEPAMFKARLVAKGFSQILGIDYNAFFGIAAMCDLELEQLDGELEEIYMDQIDSF
jgi:hypothetical protein